MGIDSTEDGPHKNATKRAADASTVECKESRDYRTGGKVLRFQPVESSLRLHFCNFMDSVPKSESVKFFRDILEDLEGKRGLIDFHMKIQSRLSWLTVEVMSGETNPGPSALKLEDCIACNLDAPIFPGMTSGETVLSEYGDPGLVRCSIDAQARPVFIVTPVRHVERLSDLTDDEMHCMWHTAAQLLRKEKLQFQSMILNHGTYRHLPHLHLKVRVIEDSHVAARKLWNPERLAAWDKLRMLCPPDERPCKFYFDRGYCREGSRCSFSHKRT